MVAIDQLSDFLCRIKNGNTIRETYVEVYSNNMVKEIVRILKEEGFISDYHLFSDGSREKMKVFLKYTSDREKLITDLRRVSKSGRRIYSSCEKLPKVKRGMGIAIISTSSGIMTDKQARKNRVGGEILCYVW